MMRRRLIFWRRRHCLSSSCVVAPGYRWLEAGVSQSPVLGRHRAKLHPGLYKLDVKKEWLVVEEETYGRDMLMKEAVYRSSEREAVVARAAEEEKAEEEVSAEEEVFELVAEFLTTRYPDIFRFEGKNKNAIRVCKGAYDRVVTRGENALEAASLLCQEDLLLLRDDRLVSSACVFSFGAVRRRTGQSLDAIHEKVGGYARDLGRIVNTAITKVTVERPLWRSNWSFSLTDSMRPSVDRDFLNLEKRRQVHGERTSLNVDDVRQATLDFFQEKGGIGKALFCKIEYQTLRRLPKSQVVLFTVHTYVEPFDRLTPKAADHLAQNIHLASIHDIALYKNLTDPALTALILNYLQDLASSPPPLR